MASRLVPVRFRALGLLACGGMLMAGCESKQSLAQDEAPATPAAAAAVAAPGPEVRAALEGQAIGAKLLGNTVKLVDGKFQPADLAKAPDYYLVYYSASW